MLYYESPPVGERLDLLQRRASVSGCALGLVEGNENVGGQAFGRRCRCRADSTALEGEATLHVIAESLLDPPLLVAGQIEFGADGVPAAKHSDVRTPQTPLSLRDRST